MKELLSDWVARQPCVGDDDLIYRSAMWNQVVFIMDEIVPLVMTGLPLESWNACVLGEHTSKGVLLPVYEITRIDVGVRLVMRNNFHNWKLSFIGKASAGSEHEFSALFHTRPPVDASYTGNPLASVYFEGFPKEDVLGYFSENPSRWSGSVLCNYPLWSVVFAIMRNIGAITPMEWARRPLPGGKLA
jgi:hypothetical protein